MPELSDRRSRDSALVASVWASVASRAITAASTLATIAIAARSLAAAEFGVVSVFSLFLIYFNFGDFGMGSAVLTQLPPAHARGDLPEVRRIVSSALSAMHLIALATVALGTFSVWVFPWRELLGAERIASSQIALMVVVFVLLGAAGIVGSVGSRVLAALQRGAFVRWSDAAAAAATVVPVAGCALVEAPISLYLLALFGPVTLGRVLQLVYVVRCYPEFSLKLFRMDFSAGWGFLRRGVPYAVLSVGWVVAFTLDAVVVALVMGAASSAVFAVAARLFGLISGTLTLAGQQMWPAMAEALARGDSQWVRVRFRQSVLASAGVAALGSIVIIAGGPTVARYWVGEELVPPVELFVALGGWTVLFTVSVQFSQLLLALDRINFLATWGVVAAVVNIVASILLTERLGLVGPVFGSLLATALLQLLPMVWLTRRWSTSRSLL